MEASTPIDSLRTSLLAAEASSSSAPPTPSPSLVVDVDQSCHLLAVPPPIRTMMLDYMDDCTATRYLSTCHFLHAGYHHYPVKQPMPEWAFRDTTQLDVYFKRLRRLRFIPIFALVESVLFVFLLLPVIIQSPWPQKGYLIAISAAVFVVSWWYFAWLLLSRRRDCCAAGWWLWRRRHTMPRVISLSTQLWDVELLPYLQHLTELVITYRKNKPFGKKYPLPHSLRTLRVLSSPDLTLKADTLPTRLTALTLSAVKNAPLSVGVLPQSLTSLHLAWGFDTRWAIGTDVLPSHLHKLQLHQWTLPLSDIALPASLIELEVRWLSDHPLPVLPPQLEVLAIGGAFNQPLTGILPPTLRILDFLGHFDLPLTASLFASVPQLEGLFLSDHSARQLIVSDLPRSLRVLRVGKRYSLVGLEASDVLPELRMLTLPAEWDVERVRTFERLGQRRGFAVVRRV